MWSTNSMFPFWLCRKMTAERTKTRRMKIHCHQIQTYAFNYFVEKNSHRWLIISRFNWYASAIRFDSIGVDSWTFFFFFFLQIQVECEFNGMNAWRVFRWISKQWSCRDRWRIDAIGCRHMLVHRYYHCANENYTDANVIRTKIYEPYAYMYKHCIYKQKSQ